MAIFPFSHPTEYIYGRLSSESEDRDSEATHATYGPTHKRDGADSNRTVFYLTLFCVVCTIINLLLLRITELKSVPQSKISGTLRRPSQFRGLDKIERPHPPTDRSIINFPFLVGLVDKSKPGITVSDVVKRPKTQEAINLPEARIVQITADVSTILQFRVLDWGMESCVLTLKLPAGPHNHTLQAADATHSLILGPETNQIDVYTLVSDSGSSSLDKVIDGGKLTHRSKPQYGNKVGTVEIEYGTQWTYRFPCATDSLHAFALASAIDSSFVEWWQDKQTDAPAIFITQYATK